MRASKAVLLALVLSAAVVPAWGQEAVHSIEFRGLRALPEETLRFYLGLEEGAPYDEAALNRHIHELWDRKLIDDIKVDKTEAEGGGVDLVITVAERPVLRSIEYKGLKGMSRTDVNERLAKDQVELHEGGPLDLGELARLKATLESMYRDKGYRFAEASYTIEEVSTTERKVIITIDEAEKVRIGKIRFEGNKVFGNWRLRWAMKKTKETGLFTRMFRKDIYNPATIQEDLGKVGDLYRGAGYKNVDVGEPELSVIKKGSKRRLGVEIPITEGARWKLGEIRIEGNTVFKDQVVRSHFKRPRSGWLRAKMISDGIDDVHEAYRNWGYIMADVRSELEERDNDVADLVVKITEGEQFRVGRLEFEGNTRTRDKVLRREFRVQEGSLLNMGAVKNSLYKLNQLQYFKLNEDDPISFENFDSEKKTVDLLVHGQESDRTELQVGGGWSEAYGFFGQISVRTLNFLGRGETVGVSYQKGAYSTQYDLSYAVPWFLDRPQSIGFQVFNTAVDYTQYLNYESRQKSQGGVVTYGRSFGLFQSASVSFSRYDRTDTLSVLDATGNLVPVVYDVSNASLRPVYAYDSRDSRVEPTRGARFSASLEYAGGFLGGNNYFVRPEIGSSIFLPVSYSPMHTVFGANAEVGWIEPTQGHSLLPLERYFLGGETTIRGFQFRDLTVRCLGGEPFPGRTAPCAKDERLIDSSFALLGGDKFLQFNLEYHLLLGGPFRVIAFADAAQVYAKSQSFDLSRLRMTAGAELRIFVPVFGAPLRFIYAKNLRPFPDDQFQSFQFSIGATF